MSRFVGRLFGIYHTSHANQAGIHQSRVLSIFGYTNIGRSYVMNFHDLRAALDGQRGPNVVAMSGTSYLPDSTRWHFDVPPKGILKPSNKSAKAIQDQNCWFKFSPVYNEASEPIRVSGSADMRTSIRQLVAALVGGYGDRGGQLRDELKHLEQLAKKYPDYWSDRERLLLLVNSYDQCLWAAEEMKSRWYEMARYIHPLVRSYHEEEMEERFDIHTGLRRVDIELFAQTDGKILIAPLQSIGRGFNILNSNGKAAFGALYFLTRPIPYPHDVSAIAQELNQRIFDWYKALYRTKI